jgi:CheY-like chemotaxis protein
MAKASKDSVRDTDAAPAQHWLERALAFVWSCSKLAGAIALLVFVVASWNDLRALLPRISRFEALGVKVEVSQLQSALEKQAASVSSPGVVVQPGAIEAAVTRALHVQGVFQGASVLWVDDSPSNNLPFRQVLRALGAGVEPARDTTEALALASTGNFDLVISDIERVTENGIDGLKVLRDSGVVAPAIFYVLRVDRGRPAPDTALGITNRPDELLHLVIDGLERSRWSNIAAAEQPVAADGPDRRR